MPVAPPHFHRDQILAPPGPSWVRIPRAAKVSEARRAVFFCGRRRRVGLSQQHTHTEAVCENETGHDYHGEHRRSTGATRARVAGVAGVPGVPHVPGRNWRGIVLPLKLLGRPSGRAWRGGAVAPPSDSD